MGAFAWPFFIIIPGLLLFAGMFLGGKSATGLAIPGSIVTTVGLILFVQNITDSFESWSYVWALIIVAVGVGRIIQGTRTEDKAALRDGSRVIAVGLALFAVFGIFFEFFIFRSWLDSLLGRYLLPALLIGAGVYLVMGRKEKSSYSAPLTPPSSNVNPTSSNGDSSEVVEEKTPQQS
jgi:hypothetical protein